MAADIFANSSDTDLRKKWALMQLKNGTDMGPSPGPIGALAKALQGSIGGYMAGQADAEDKKAGEDMFNSLPGISRPAVAPAQPMPMSNAPSADVSQPRGIRNNNPLNIEAGGFTQGQPGFSGSDGRFAKFENQDQGIQAANKLLDIYRDKHGLNTVSGIVGRWAPSTDGNNVSAYASNVAGKLGIDPNAPIPPEMRQRLIEAMAQHENGQPIGQQPFQVASLGPVAAPGQPATPSFMPPAGAQVAQNGPPGAAPPQAQNAPAPNRSSVQIPPDVQETIKRLGADPRTRPQALQLYMQYAKPVETIQPMTPEQRKQWNVPEGMSAGIDVVTGKPTFSPPQTNIALNTAQKGQEVMATESAQDFKAAQAAGRDATKRAGVWDSMENASKGFTPGATAEIKLQAKRYLKDLGVIEGADVPDAEVFKQLQQQLAIHAQPKGQGAVSNFEREMYAKSIASMTMSPEALSRAIQTGRKLDDFDRKVAQIYRDNARKNGGVPNSIDINEEIDKLGAPLSQSEMNYLRKSGDKQTPQAASGGSSASPQGVDPKVWGAMTPEERALWK